MTFAGVVRSEWTKVCSLRSTWWVLGVAGVFAVGLAGVTGWAVSKDRATLPVGEAVGNAFLAIDALALVFGVFGVLLMTGEYGSGLIRATLTAVPRRLPVLAAKALVLVAVTLPAAMVIAFASFLVNQAFFDADGRVSLGDPEVLLATIGAACAPVALALLGLGAGTMLRHTAGALTAYAAAILIVPALLGPALPDSVEDNVLPYVPTMAGQALYQAGGDSDTFPWMLSPGAGALALAGWTVLLMAGGAVVLRRRDA